MAATHRQDPATGIDPERLYTFAEIAGFFGGDVTERTVRRWTSESKMPFTPLPGGRGRRIRGRQFTEFMDSLAVDVEA